MKKFTLLLMSLLFLQTATAANFESGSKLYLKVSENWASSNARFAAYFYDENTNEWVSMTRITGTTYDYEVTIPGNYPNVIFCRMNGESTENNWDNKWNQTGDLSCQEGKSYYTIPDSGWDSFGDEYWSSSSSTTLVQNFEKGTTLYLQVPADAIPGARFAAYFFVDNSYEWVSMTLVEGTTFTLTVPNDYPNVIFCRMNGESTENNWDNKWDQTGDLSYQEGANCYQITAGWPGTTNVDLKGQWTTYTPADIPVPATLYIAGENLDNWNKRSEMETSDGKTFIWRGKLEGEFKFYVSATSDEGQFGALQTTSVSLGTRYDLSYTGGSSMGSFKLDYSITCVVRVNVETKQVRVLPENIYIAGSSTVAKIRQGAEWSATEVQGCVRDEENGTYTWTGYLYDNNGDKDGSRFKFILSGQFANGGHFIPVDDAVRPVYETPYKIEFKWDDSSSHLFHSEGAEGSEWRNDLKNFSDETAASRLKIKAVVNLDDMTVTFYKVDDSYTIERLYIAGAATEFGTDGRGELSLSFDEYSDLYEGTVNFLNTDRGFLFPLQETELLPALHANTDNYVANYFELCGLDYCVAEESDCQFKVPSPGVYRVEIRPDYNSLKLHPYYTTFPVNYTELTGDVFGKLVTSQMKVEFFEEIVSVDPTKIHITPEDWTTADGSDHKVIVRNTDNNTVTFYVNSWDSCLDYGKEYTVTFDAGAVTFAQTARSSEARYNPEFNYLFSIKEQTIGTGIEKCGTTRGIVYKNRTVTAEGLIEVYDLTGSLVTRGENNVDLSAVACGIYIVRNGNEILKIIRR